MKRENPDANPVAGQANEADRGIGARDDGEPDEPVIVDDERARPEHDRSPLI